MADGLCSDGKTVSSLINENSTENCDDLVVRGKSISADSVACPNGKFQMSETQKMGIKRNHKMMMGANQVQHNKFDPELSDVYKISDSDSDCGGDDIGSGNNKNSANSLVVVGGESIFVNDKKNVSSGASVVLRKNTSGKSLSLSIAPEKGTCNSPGLGAGGGPDVDLTKGPDTAQSQSGQEADDSRTKKKRCSDRYDSSESSDSGVATLSCTDSSTHSSDASDPGSPYSPVSLGDDVHQTTKANMPPQNVLATQAHQQPQQNQQQKSTQHQWPWNAISNSLSNTTTTTANNNNNNNNNTNNNNNNNFSASNKNNVNSVASSNKHKRLTINSSDTNGTAKKARTSCVDSKNHPVVPSAVKRLKAAPTDESQTKITGYFKSQMKPLSALKKDFTNFVARSTDVQPSSGLDKYFNILAKVKDDKEHKTKSLEVDVRTLTTMPPSLKKIERKMTKVAQVAPISRKAAAAQLAKSPKKHVAIAPRTTESKKTSVSNTLRKSATSVQVDQTKISQPTVLLTAIRIPQTSGQQSSSQQAHQSPKTGSSPAKVGSVFQIPVMPNLVQIPNLLATANGTNLVMNNGQIARVGNGAQYFLNGTVIKLQQIASGGGHGVNSNNGVLTMESGLSGNILVKPPTIAQAVPLTTPSNTKSTLPISQQSPIVTQTGVTGNGCGPGISGQTFTSSQRLSAQPVFMATTTGLLLNATLPAVIATTTSKIAGSLPPQAMPALQPIQSAATQSSNILPSLSTILQTHHHTAATSQSSIIQPQAQFIVSQADAILSNIPQSTLSTTTAKSSSCTALLAATSIANSVSSPVPPLVTLASTHETISTSVTLARNKQSILYDEDKKQIENGILSKVSKYECKILPDLEIKQEKSQLSKITDINSLFDKLKNEPPYLPIEKVKEEPIVKQELKPHVFKEELKPCLPSPKSFVLEQIKQKTPPDVFTDESIKMETSSSNSVDTRSSPTDDLKSTSIDTDIEETTLPKCAISPILSQPKTIRFPALSGETAYRFGPKGTKRHDGVCYWDNCNEKHDTSSKLLDHLQTHHVNTQSGPFACLWSGCKVHGRESCSRRWLERHVLSHGGTKPFKCIVDGCGLRFGSQLALQKHVNGHFNATEHKDNPSKRASDPPVPKQLRKNGKKLRYRRQPFSARMFDFFDSGVMEGLQHRLMVTGSLASGPKGSVTFRGRVMARRCTSEGVSEIFISWSPSEIISDEWVPEIKATLTKTVAIHSLRIQERVALQGRLRTANLYSDISTMFNQTSSSITASKSNLLRTSDRKQSRKPPKRIQPS